MNKSLLHPIHLRSVQSVRALGHVLQVSLGLSSLPGAATDKVRSDEAALLLHGAPGHAVLLARALDTLGSLAAKGDRANRGQSRLCSC